LLSIITDLVSIATIEAGQKKINETMINLNSICGLIYDQFLSKARLKDVDFNYYTALPDAEAFITSDEPKLDQVLSNLINNARIREKHYQVLYPFISSKRLDYLRSSSR